MVRPARDLALANEILRFAQDDGWVRLPRYRGGV